jgi:hypothetical protein
MYSEDLHLATSRTSYWHHVKKSMLPTRNIKQATLNRKRLFARIPEHPPLTKTEVVKEHNAARKTLRDVRRKKAQNIAASTSNASPRQ